MEDYWFNEILIRERGLRVVKHKIIRLASSKRDNAILEAGYNLEIIWEHEFKD